LPTTLKLQGAMLGVLTVSDILSLWENHIKENQLKTIIEKNAILAIENSRENFTR